MNVGVCGAGIFALLDCLPGMAFTLTLFRKRLRLGVRATVAVCALLVVIQVVAGRNIAVLVEAAVRNAILQLRGIDTYQEFVMRHRRAMESGESF